MWRRITHVGSDEVSDPQAAKYIILLNSLATIGALLVFGYFPMLARQWPESRSFTIVAVTSMFATLFVLVLNGLGLPLAARLFFNLSAMATFTILALMGGGAINAHLYLVLVVIAAFFIYPPTQRAYRLCMISLALGLFFAVEIRFLDHHGFFPLDPAFSAEARIFLNTGLVVYILGFAFYSHRIYLRAQDQADFLLRNILPEKIANVLKGGRSLPARRFDECSVLFADIAGFTSFSATVSPERLVAILNDIFSCLDDLVDRYGLEKIKTIGDAYMAAAGLPDPRSDHAAAAADFALEARDAVSHLMHSLGVGLRFRIGIHSGPVVAGVIGKRKFIYDLWGDTVNIASRMESHGVEGHIQVSRDTWELLKGSYLFEARGTIEIRGRGALETYILLGRTKA